MGEPYTIRIFVPDGDPEGLRIIDRYDPVLRHSVGLAYRSNRYQNIAARGFSTLCRTIVPRLLVRPKHSHHSPVTTG